MKKIGDALKKAVEDKPPDSETEVKRRGRASPLLNHNRKSIFQALCLKPCITVTDLASELELSRPTVNWHINDLVKNSYVSGAEYFNRRVFWPMGMLTSEDTKKTMSLLNQEIPNRLYSKVLDNPGTTTVELKKNLGNPGSLRRILSTLQETGLITPLRDGRNLRYYPTPKLQDLVNTERKGHRGFRRNLLKRLEKEYLRPEIKEIKGKGLVITLHNGKEEIRLEIPYSPIERALASFS